MSADTSNAYDNVAFSRSPESPGIPEQVQIISYKSTPDNHNSHHNKNPQNDYTDSPSAAYRPSNGGSNVSSVSTADITPAHPSGLSGHDNRAFTGYGDGTSTPSFSVPKSSSSNTSRVETNVKPVSSVYTVPVPTGTAAAPTGKSKDESNKTSCSWNKRMCIIISAVIAALLVATGIAVGVGVGVSLSNSSDNSTKCSSSEFECKEGECIRYWKQCDSINDCSNKKDELNCVCPMGQHLCGDGSTCIMREWLCDREFDCPQHDDELHCGTCSSEEYQCTDYSCIGISQRCDGQPNCADLSDEFNCLSRNSASNNVIYGVTGSGSLPVCADGVSEALADQICISLGLSGPSARTSSPVVSSLFLKAGTYVTNTTQSIMASFSQQSQCSGNLGLVVTCSSKACGHSSSESSIQAFIANGEDASLGQWPWQVAIYMNGLFLCGGSLIDEYHVVTAAHCIGTLDETAYTLRLGTIQRTEPSSSEQFAYVLRIDSHPQFKPDNYRDGYDIAVMTLRERVRLNNFVQPVCLVDPLDVTPFSSICYSTGWGATNSSQVDNLPEKLQQAKMRLWSLAQCRQAYPYATDRLQCAGYESGYIANCPGDSGGPLVCKDPRGYWKLVGVFSFLTVGCNVPEKPSVFSHVQSLVTWVENVTVCQFYCDNGKCLWDVRQLCNGVDNCGDKSDETKTCTPSISCTFETGYMCGYRVDTGQGSQWTRKAGPDRINLGPITDFTYGTTSGNYMYAGSGTTVLQAPLYNQTSASCLQFFYHIRASSSLAGRLHVKVAPAPGSSGSPSAFDDGGYNLGDIWYTKRMDISAGVYQISFTASSVNSSLNAYIGLDNVMLLTGTCAQQRCSSGQFDCGTGTPGSDDLCIDVSQRCNFFSNCFSEQDEFNCQSKSAYLCDFSAIGKCGLEQPPTDTGDWSIQTAAVANRIAGSPSRDATFSSSTGYYAYIMTGPGNTPGVASELFLPINLLPSQSACFSMRYSIVSTGRLSVVSQISNDNPQTLWTVANTNQSAWQHMQVALPRNTTQITVQGIVGSNTGTPITSYIAVDDVAISPGACPLKVCGVDEVQCSDSSCVSQSRVCDGRTDCSDGADEKSCACQATSFRCADGSACLNAHVRCDGVNNCRDQSDELQCSSCNSTIEYTCRSDGRCKLLVTWCDGFTDCSDGSDEISGCQTLSAPGVITSNPLSTTTTNPTSTTTRNSWTCTTGSQCVMNSSRCNFVKDCRDGSDEKNCDFYTCPSGVKINPQNRCDAVPDCPDAADELYCDCDNTTSFQCPAGKCLPLSARCNGKVECLDYSDEMGCNCTSSQFRCDNGMCIVGFRKCDGTNDCQDFSDERNCQCEVGDFKCTNGLCINGAWRCDYMDDCGDDSDETTNCSCKPAETRCASGKCLQKEWLCDGYKDCPDGSDEKGCRTCDSSKFQCTNYACINMTQRCDGRADCTDGADEFNCVKLALFNSAPNVVLGYNPSDQSYLPVCGDGWTNDQSSTVCQLARLGPPLSYIPISTSSSSQPTLIIPNNSFTDFTQATVSTRCSQIIRVTCGDAQCGTQKVEGVGPLVIRGETATEGQWPWAVALFYNDAYQCSASLISPRWVITAAHCLFHATTTYSLVPLGKYFSVRIGTTKRTGTTAHLVQVGVDKVFMHPSYHVSNDMLYDDLALVHLTHDVTYNDYVTPVCMPGSDGGRVMRGELCYALGWGLTRPEYGDPAQDLRYLKMEIWSGPVCATPLYWGNLRTDGSQICAGYTSGAVTMCNGDSGGPLMCRDLNKRWILKGVVSAGTSGPNGCQGTTVSKPTIFTNVSSYEPWINSVINQNGG